MWPDVVVNLSTSVICFLSVCYPALTGESTPSGEFTLQPYTTDSQGYGGTILVFKETEHSVFAIHRLIDVLGQNRNQRIKSEQPLDRVITNGCVNVSPEVFDALIDCCSGSKLIIK